MGGVKEIFAPATSLSDTVDAMLDYWVVRNMQWKAKYGTRKKAKQWLEEAYDMSDMQKVEGVVPFLGDQLKSGEPIPTYNIEYGPPGHRCVLNFMPLRREGAKAKIKYTGGRLCHKNCAVMAPREREAMRQVADNFVKSYYGSDVSAEVL